MKTKQLANRPFATLSLLGALAAGAHATTICCDVNFSCGGSLSPDADPSCPLSIGALCEEGGIDAGAGYAGWSPVQGGASSRVYNPSTMSAGTPTVSSSDYMCMVLSPGADHCLSTGMDDSGNSINSTISITFGSAVSSGSSGSMDFSILAAYSVDNGISFTTLGLASNNQAAYNSIDEQDADFGASNVPGWNVSLTTASWAIDTGILDPGQSVEVRFFLGVNDNTHAGSWDDDNNVKAVFIEEIGGGNICSVQSIPEPSSAFLLGLSSLLLLRHRRK
ncbi:MAG: PEP-CTERM sorting domain-containing protein [Roseibacillus sp.]